MRATLSVAVACLSLGFPASVAAAPVFVGDFETGDVDQWQGTLNGENITPLATNVIVTVS